MGAWIVEATDVVASDATTATVTDADNVHDVDVDGNRHGHRMHGHGR